MKKHLWADFSSAELASRSSSSTVAVLPMAAIEQHGPHLPLGVDWFLADSFLGQALTYAESHDDVVVLPTMSIGISEEHLDFPGTLSLPPEVAIAHCKALARAVAQLGMGKLLLFNAHGGNVGLMDIVGRQIRRETGLHVFHTNWYDLAEPNFMSELFGQTEWRFGIHAGDVETSLMMALKPELVHLDRLARHETAAQMKAKDFHLLGDGRSAKQSWMAKDYSPSGAMGDASVATAEKGTRVMEHVGRRLMALIREVSAFK